ncbi:TolC family protein [Leptospira licerasiae]|uniref:Outer membrane efflux protein n=1 Tax=Leptospira licerasiae str. MMD4847 TaxID=1049971 RepID=A0ABN0H8D6_9LEPT|nr:TolC family protein [Leptospira licerasiae]EID99689.1 outer membrane efflux protein [Leptospira licerasiae serovar Varillal str. VAR 010]EJZ41557.1 outer membrane efflux protein [Leptospira licerasiae str. MMD4847]
MFRKTVQIILIFLFSGSPGLFSQTETVISIEDFMAKAEKTSPDVAAKIFQAKRAEEDVGAAKSAYMPTAYFSGMVTSGLPGSFGEPGVMVPRGVMVSPFHAGPSAGIWGQYTLYDWGRRENDVKVAETQAKERKEEIRIARVEVLDTSVRSYYACSRNRSLSELWSGLNGDLEIIHREVLRFVRNGQKSIVDKYLIEAQVEQIKTQTHDYELRLNKGREELGLLIQEDWNNFSCPSITSINLGPLPETESKSSKESQSEKNTTYDNSPIVNRAKMELLAAEAKLDRSKADFMPELKSSYSVGTFEQARLVPYQNYSANLSLVVPVFEGMKTVREVKAAEHEVSSKRKELEAARKKIAELNIGLGKTIDSSALRIRHLRNEVSLAKTAYEVARNRYTSYQGNLVDFREAFRNLLRANGELIDAYTEYLIYTKVKDLVNGNI